MRVTQYSSKYRVLIRGSLVIWKRLIRTRTHHWITRRRNKTRMYHRTPTRECEHCRIARKGRRPLPPQRSTEIAERNRVDTSVRATSIHCTSQPLRPMSTVRTQSTWHDEDENNADAENRRKTSSRYHGSYGHKVNRFFESWIRLVAAIFSNYPCIRWEALLFNWNICTQCI